MKLLKAIDYIEAHLTADLSLELVSGAAGLSSYHFSRMFRAVTGETVTAYIRRRRLTEAARRLIDRNERLIDLAMTYGFESQAAFSRAFKRQFGIPPGAFRKARRAMPWACRPAFTADDLKLQEEFGTLEPQILEKPAFKVIGLAGSFNQETNVRIPDLWRTFRERHGEIESAVAGHYFGMCIGVEDDSFTYMAAVETQDLDKVPEGLCGLEVAAQTYAVFTVPLAGKEPIGREIGRANRFVWNTWLPQSGYVFARAPDFEYYDERFDPKTLCGEIDLYIPVRRA